MPEILTESFCERCGTRYTFESAPPKARMGRFKTLSKGLKNFVLDDDTSLDEAMAAARNEESRESTAEQLDAFHKTFNFCMSCRQYTCSNCWNEAQGECLTCSPLAGRGLATAWGRGDGDGSLAWPAEATERPGIEAVAWPTVDRKPDEPETPAEEPWPLAALEGRLPAAEPEPAEAEAADASPSATTREERAAAAAANTADLLARFRPGQSLDEALAAYEASLEPADQPAAASEPFGAEPESEPAAAWPEPEPQLEPEPTWPEPEPEPVAWPEPEPLYAQPEPAAETPPPPEPIVWPEPAPRPEPSRPFPAPARAPDDVVEVPTWHVVAPDAAPGNGHPEPLRPAARQDLPTPQWPGQSAESFLAARLAARKAGDDMWAASSVEVLGPPRDGTAGPVGVQGCVSCGLSLSATARFCRRCGTRQG